MNAAQLSNKELAAVLWALSEGWRERLYELVARFSGYGAKYDLGAMTLVERFGLLLHLERQAAHEESQA